MVLGALVVACFAATPVMWAAAPRQHSRMEERRGVQITRQAEPALLDGAWRLLTSLWGMQGSAVDPNGNHLAACSNGFTLSPLGICVPVPVP